MFRRVEAYITPVLLSHVEKYVKDFKPEHTELSLWSGSVTLHNLELRTDVIQREFNLPFNLASGHIHELTIQVPWTKIISEPIIVTVNTIECVLKLKENNSAEGTDPPIVETAKEELDAPPGYTQSLVNRIVNNIAFRCHNLILKYVEEDIVVSVNIKHFHYDSVNNEWKAMFNEMTPDDLHLRKLMRLSDLTLCLDKRNAAGKIETYLEPLLYRCELEFRLDNSYKSMTSKRPLNTKISIHSPKLEFSVSYQQIPMVMRLAALVYALKQKNIQIETANNSSNIFTSSPTLDQDKSSGNQESQESWGGWIWSFVPQLPLGYDEDESQDDSGRISSSIVLISMNLEKVTIAFKIPEWISDTPGLYGGIKKTRYVSTCCFELSSIIYQSSSIGFERFCMRSGIRSIILYPGTCVCGVEENKEQPILKTVDTHNEVEYPSWPVEDDISNTIDSLTDEEMLAVCPAFAFSYLYKMTIPEDIEDKLNIAEMDMEYSNFKESAMMKIVAGKFTLNICAGSFHRFSVIKSAVATYDYAPYFKYKPLLKLNELPPPSTEDYDTLSEFVPNIHIQVIFQKPQVKIFPWDHPPSISKNVNLIDKTVFTKRKISQSNDQNWLFENFKGLPCLLLDAENIEISISKPMYPRRLTYVSSQLPEPAPLMLESCYSNMKMKMQHFRCFIQHRVPSKKKNSQSDNLKSVLKPIITDCTLCTAVKHLVLPEYWIHNDVLSLSDFTFNIDNLSISGTMPKILLAYNIVQFIHPEFCDTSKGTPILLTTSLIKDATEDDGMPHMELIIDGISLRKLSLKNVTTYRAVMNNLKLFAIQPNKEKRENPLEQIWIVTAPDNTTPINTPLCKIVAQLSKDETHPSFVICKLEKIQTVFDPVLINWLTYQYEHSEKLFNKDISSSTSKKSPSERQLSASKSTEDVFNRSIKLSNRHSLGQSSSDREKDFVHGSSLASQNVNEVPINAIHIQPQKQIISNRSLIDRIIETLYEWRYTGIFIEIDHLSIAFPAQINSVFQTIYTDSTEDLLSTLNTTENIFYIRLPSLVIKTSTLKQNLLNYCLYGLPVKLPDSVWEKGTLAYPLSISLTGMNCQTIHNNIQSSENYVYDEFSLPILREVSSNITVTFTPKTGPIPENKASVPPAKGKNISKGKHAKKKWTHLPTDEANTIIDCDTGDDKEVELKLSSLGICVHIDTGPLIFSFCNYQIAVMISVFNSLLNLLASLDTNDKKYTHNTVLPHKPRVRKASEHSHDNQDYSTIEYSSTADSYALKTDTLQRQKSNLCSSYEELDSGIMKESLTETADTDDNLIDSDTNAIKDKLSLTGWFQWTISNILVKVYASSDNETSGLFVKDVKHDLKLVICAEDIMASLDIQAEYFKLKSKIVTSFVHCFDRVHPKESWKLNVFSGVLMAGRENENSGPSNDENCFISLTLTRARSSSVHSKWGDLRKKVHKAHLLSNSYISEVEVSLQSLDIVLSFVSIEPFFEAFLPHFVGISSVLSKFNNMSNKTTEPYMITDPCRWDSQKYPLFYLETNKIKIFIPLNVPHSDCTFSQDVFIIQIDKISTIPVADNPICRSPLRPDLYQKAARDCILNIPGSLLEDRQCQFSIKRMSLQTAQWFQLQNIFSSSENKDEMFNENPAFKWNNSDQDLGVKSCDPPISIIQTLDICLVIALSMFQNQELVCGPSVDFSILTDIDISVCIQQIDLLMKIMNKSQSMIEKWSEFARIKKPNIREKYDTSFKSPSFIDIYQFQGDEESTSSSNIVPLKTPTLKHLQTSSYKKPSSIVSFDLCVTLGKININIYECQKLSEMELNEISNHSLKVSPLLHIGLYQPNFLYSSHNYSQKLQSSLFSAAINLSDKVLEHGESLSKDDFELSLLETSLGMPNQATGILPALLMAKWESNMGNKNMAKVDIGCPVKFSMSAVNIKKINRLLQLHKELTKKYCNISKNESETENYDGNSSQAFFGYIHYLDISTSQLVITMITENIDPNFEMSFSFAESKFNITTVTRPDKVSVIGTVDSIMASIKEVNKNPRKIIIFPWNIGFDYKILFNHRKPASFFSMNSTYVEMMMKSDKLSIDLDIDHCVMLKSFIHFWSEYYKKFAQTNTDRIVNVGKECCFWDENTVYDQHYKDDLRAGAFKFIVSSTGQPLPYQVFINPSGLVWKYPQPRAITRVHSFPVPFQNDNSTQIAIVKCTLEYYCELLGEFVVYTIFYIKQDHGVKLELEKFNQNIILASTWRVVIHLEDMDEMETARNVRYNKKNFFQPKHSDPSASSNYTFDSFPIKAHTLAACLRIDSYFSPHLMSKVKFAFDISTIEVCFYNTIENVINVNNRAIDMFTVDSISPPPHIFCRLAFNNNRTVLRVWDADTILCKISSQISCEAVNGSNLSLYKVMEIKDLHIRSWIGGRREDEAKVELTMTRFNLTGGPHLTRPLLNSLYLWQLHLNKDKLNGNVCTECAMTKSELAIQKYVIKNDTNVLIRFGQEQTDEHIMLPSRHSIYYSWRSSFKDSLLRFAIQERDWQSSKGFQIDKVGVSTIELICDDESLPKLTMVILVEDLQSDQTVVTFMGRLIITNLLMNNFDFKLFQKKHNKSHTMVSPVFSIAADTRSPSLFVDNDAETTFRLKFSDYDTGWTGDIPLKECVKGNIPWLVKVPAKESMQYVSIWCRVVVDSVHGRILVILSPLYFIKSHLPMDVSIKLSSENIESTSDIVIKGKRSLLPVNCPGTTATKHEMIFSSHDNHVHSAKTNVPFNFGLVNQATFFPNKKDLPDIDTLIENIRLWRTGVQPDLLEWPYISDVDENWMVTDAEIDTEVSIRYMPAVPGVDSMVVDLTPWALFANSTGLTVGIADSDGHFACKVNNKTVVTPPSFIQTEIFYISLNLENVDYLSEKLILSTEVLGPYEKREKGKVLINENTTFTIVLNDSICKMCLSYEVKCNITIFHLSCKYILCNKSSIDLCVLPAYLPSSSTSKLIIPYDHHQFTLKLQTDERSLGIPILKFHSKDSSADDDCDLFIFIGSDGNSSNFACPIRINPSLLRKSISIQTNKKSIPLVVTFQDVKRQTIITVHNDVYPQLQIKNDSKVPIYVGQIIPESVIHESDNFLTNQDPHSRNVVEECIKSDWHCLANPEESVYYTMPMENNQYPDISPVVSSGTTNSYLSLAYANVDGNQQLLWSSPINTKINTTEHFIKLPGYTGDIKVTVDCSFHLTIITIQNVTEIDISASDIRHRLMGSVENNLLNSSNVISEQLHNESINKLSKEDLSKLSKDNLTENVIEHFLKRFKISMIVNELEIRFTSDERNNDETPVGDVLYIICDKFALCTTIKDKGINIQSCFNNIQIDNPLFLNGGYDFQVFLLRQMDAGDETIINWKHRESKDLSESLDLDAIINELQNNYFLMISVDMEIWKENDFVRNGVSDIRINLQPVRVYLEDTYLSTLLDYITNFFPSYSEISCLHKNANGYNVDLIHSSSNGVLCVSNVNIPEHVMWESTSIANPIKLRRFYIESINMLLSVHTSAVLYIAFDHSPLQFGNFEKTNILTSSYRLGHALTMHYLSEAIFGAGWVVGSLEILGSPGGLARRVGAGLRDLVREPCRGLLRGPWPFLVGVTHGSASLIKHVTQGTVESVSMVMGSVARNLDRLSLDEDHMRRTERERRLQPNGIGQALSRGLRGLGLSLLGAIGGIAHETIVVGCERGGTPSALAAGLTRGLIGAVTKPLSATADLLALAGHGLLNQAGWDPHPQMMWRFKKAEFVHQSSIIKLGPSLKEQNLVYICQMIDKDTDLTVSVIVTNSWLILLDEKTEKVRDMIDIKKIYTIKDDIDNGDITIIVSQNENSSSVVQQNVESQEHVIMDPVSRARVAAFIGIIEDNTQTQKIYRFKTCPNLSLHYVNILKTAYLSIYDNYWFSVL